MIQNQEIIRLNNLHKDSLKEHTSNIMIKLLPLFDSLLKSKKYKNEVLCTLNNLEIK